MFEQIEQFSLYGIQLINFESLGSLVLRFSIDLIFAFIVIRMIFYKIYKETDYVFTMFMINICIFLIVFLLGSIKLKIGFAFGLFAVFSIIRYRTEQIPIKQMTYLFVAIIIAVINALTHKKVSYVELLLANSIIVLIIYVIENNFLHKKNEFVKLIKYEKIELIRPENYDKLLADLKMRTGFNINRVEVDSINFLNDTAKLKIVYEYPDNTKNKA
ncbi:MAG: DUF4956 domain-containing protein [Candidatus Delongbacteria bacterium]|jgi:hypothetical protein|nr:DUF4956 domain-containing protein [Candidatus Delongbacteria bacterium]